MVSLGEELKRERELREISLREISEATKISVRILEAIENDNYGKLPGGIFNRNFLRAYAGFIGLDPEIIVRKYQQIYSGLPVDSFASRPDVFQPRKRSSARPEKKSNASTGFRCIVNNRFCRLLGVCQDKTSMNLASSLVDQIKAGQAPQNLREFAAQGMLPLSEEELVPLQILLLQDAEAPIRDMAATALKNVSDETWLRLVDRKEPEAEVVDYVLKNKPGSDDIKEKILLNHSVPDSISERLPLPIRGKQSTLS